MKRLIYVTLFQLFVFAIFGQSVTAYEIYNAKGKKVSFKKMIKTLEEKDIILFGEIHDNPISHWMQYEVTKELNNKRKLILGAEMFETDNQIPLDEYLAGSIDDKELDSLARLWTNYKTDYAPLVDFAKENSLPFVATNIPRRYASMVYKQGFESLDSLSKEEKLWIAPLPIAFDSELPTYKTILDLVGDHGTPELVMAQAIKDATMANFIAKNHIDGHLSLHYNGTFHSNFYEGILWYLKRENEDYDYATISTVSQKDVKKLTNENKGMADFIICVDEDMTTTY